MGRPVTRWRYYEQVSDHVADARSYLARRTDELTNRRTALAKRAAQLRARQPFAHDHIVAARRAAADELAEAVAAHRHNATQHEATALAHERCAELLDGRGATDRAVHHRQAATLERDAAQRSRAEADRAERQGKPAHS
jgi:hypothetical protein